jgi:hypothetical protein
MEDGQIAYCEGIFKFKREEDDDFRYLLQMHGEKVKNYDSFQWGLCKKEMNPQYEAIERTLDLVYIERLYQEDYKEFQPIPDDDVFGQKLATRTSEILLNTWEAEGLIKFRDGYLFSHPR